MQGTSFQYLVGELRSDMQQNNLPQVPQLLSLQATASVHAPQRKISHVATKTHAARKINILEAESCSVVSNFFVTPWTAANQVPLSMGFPRQGYWNRLLFPPPYFRKETLNKV